MRTRTPFILTPRLGCVNIDIVTAVDVLQAVDAGAALTIGILADVAGVVFRCRVVSGRRIIPAGVAAGITDERINEHSLGVDPFPLRDPPPYSGYHTTPAALSNSGTAPHASIAPTVGAP